MDARSIAVHRARPQADVHALRRVAWTRRSRPGACRANATRPDSGDAWRAGCWLSRRIRPSSAPWRIPPPPPLIGKDGSKVMRNSMRRTCGELHQVELSRLRRSVSEKVHEVGAGSLPSFPLFSSGSLAHDPVFSCDARCGGPIGQPARPDLLLESWQLRTRTENLHPFYGDSPDAGMQPNGNSALHNGRQVSGDAARN